MTYNLGRREYPYLVSDSIISIGPRGDESDGLVGLEVDEGECDLKGENEGSDEPHLVRRELGNNGLQLVIGVVDDEVFFSIYWSLAVEKVLILA